MSKRSIEIDRLEIRLKGVSPESARAAVGDLGRDVLGQLAQQGQRPAPTGTIDRVDAGSARLTSGATPSELRETIAGRIVRSINSTPRNAS
jgi:hypothetical protein